MNLRKTDDSDARAGQPHEYVVRPALVTHRERYAPPMVPGTIDASTEVNPPSSVLGLDGEETTWNALMTELLCIASSTVHPALEVDMLIPRDVLHSAPQRGVRVRDDKTSHALPRGQFLGFTRAGWAPQLRHRQIWRRHCRYAARAIRRQLRACSPASMALCACSATRPSS